METTNSALGAVILQTKTLEVYDKDTGKQINVEPGEIVSLDVEARKWLVKNIDTLKEIVNDYQIKNSSKVTINEPKFGVRLKTQNSEMSEQTITITSTDKRDIDSIISFVNKVHQEIERGTMINSISYISSRKLKSPLYIYHKLKELYNFDTVDLIYDGEIPEGTRYVSFEYYTFIMRYDLHRMLEYKTFLNFWEKIIYRKELKAITVLTSLYEMEFDEDI